MKDRHSLKVLFNPTQEERLEREPLLAFSFYLSGKNNILLSLSDTIIEQLNEGFKDPRNLNINLIGEASTSFWFWSLGAYEVVRTISQAKDCFSTTFLDKINILKKQLSIVRMPSAKMEEQGRKKPVNSNRSPDDWNIESKDLLVGSPDNPLSARELIELYDQTLCSLTPSDVVKRHDESY
ncbi:hypothetical protein HB364_23710 [Pseudoflavitalea sp. X16]|uniref:hypothetical protein n=1 Tax=Paraflavitalea devenefica TaxID=2716334 RepID=UPI001422604D|nr:hypothetical protein [Paraflavitalea devenefica]NII28110.1 hypothetical protein [Paraflavitalea devenefica]